jgi:hypothetical protein
MPKPPPKRHQRPAWLFPAELTRRRTPPHHRGRGHQQPRLPSLPPHRRAIASTARREAGRPAVPPSSPRDRRGPPPPAARACRGSPRALARPSLALGWTNIPAERTAGRRSAAPFAGSGPGRSGQRGGTGSRFGLSLPAQRPPRTGHRQAASAPRSKALAFARDGGSAPTVGE